MATPPFSVEKLTIPLFIGTSLNFTLLGTLAVQVYLYFLAFPKDRRLSKVLVLFVILAEALQTLSDARSAIRTFGAGWGDYALLDKVGWAWFSVPVIGSSIACAGQLFFAWRIYVLGNKTLPMPIAIVTVTIVQWGAGLWTGVMICQAGRFSLLQFNYLKPPVVWLAATALADLMIVAGTVFYVLRARQPGFIHTRTLINRILKVTTETGVLCAVFALVDLSLYVKFNGNNYHLAVCTWLSKVYSNSILVILNSRAHIGHESAAPATVNISRVTEIAFSAPTSSTRIPTMRSTFDSAATDKYNGIEVA